MEQIDNTVEWNANVNFFLSATVSQKVELWGKVHIVLVHVSTSTLTPSQIQVHHFNYLQEVSKSSFSIFDCVCTIVKLSFW